MCEECEKIFGSYDQYAAELLLNSEKDQKPLTQNNEVVGWQIDTFDYKRLKLFLISLLWRAGASEQIQFQKIKLGKYLDKAKGLLLTGSSGAENDFSFIIARFGDAAGQAHFADPHPELKNDVFGKLNAYRFYLGAGYIVYIKVDKRPFPEESLPVVATLGKPLIIMRRTDFLLSKEFEVMKKVFLAANETQNRLKNRNL